MKRIGKEQSAPLDSLPSSLLPTSRSQQSCTHQWKSLLRQRISWSLQLLRQCFDGKPMVGGSQVHLNVAVHSSCASTLLRDTYSSPLWQEFLCPTTTCSGCSTRGQPRSATMLTWLLTVRTLFRHVLSQRECIERIITCAQQTVTRTSAENIRSSRRGVRETKDVV